MLECLLSKSQKTTDAGCGEKGSIPCVLLVAMEPDTATMRKWSFLQKLKTELPFDLASPCLGIYTKEVKLLSQGGTYTPKFIAAAFTISKIWKQPKRPPVDE